MTLYYYYVYCGNTTVSDFLVVANLLLCSNTDVMCLCLQILSETKRMLLQCATPESIVRFGNAEIEHTYFKEQCHENVFEFLHHAFVKNKPADSLHLQVCNSFCEFFLCNRMSH